MSVSLGPVCLFGYILPSRPLYPTTQPAPARTPGCVIPYHMTHLMGSVSAKAFSVHIHRDHTKGPAIRNLLLFKRIARNNISPGVTWLSSTEQLSGAVQQYSEPQSRDHVSNIMYTFLPQAFICPRTPRSPTTSNRLCVNKYLLAKLLGYLAT